MFSYLDFRSYFEADGPNQIASIFPVKYFCRRNSWPKEHFLIVKMAAKQPAQVFFVAVLRAVHLPLCFSYKHCFFTAIFYKNKAVAICSHRLLLFILVNNHNVFVFQRRITSFLVSLKYYVLLYYLYNL